MLSHSAVEVDEVNHSIHPRRRTDVDAGVMRAGRQPRRLRRVRRCVAARHADNDAALNALASSGYAVFARLRHAPEHAFRMRSWTYDRKSHISGARGRVSSGPAARGYPWSFVRRRVAELSTPGRIHDFERSSALGSGRLAVVRGAPTPDPRRAIGHRGVH